MPIPPPRVRPEIPTEGPQPAGMVMPCPSSASYTSPRRAPAPTVAASPETDTERMDETSITTPFVEERPAKQCPPLRVITPSPDRLANEMVSRTSSGTLQSTIACGVASWKRGMAGLRADSYADEPGRTTSPASGPRNLCQSGVGRVTTISYSHAHL